MQYWMLPFEKQTDYGFGVMGETYFRTGDRLYRACKIHQKVGYGIFPAGFVCRHSVELFLKSCIILVYKKYHIPFRDGNYNSQPMCKVNEKWKSLYHVHDILDLFKYFRLLFSQKYDDISEKTHTNDWPFLSEKYITDVQKISEYDEKSDYFRYPISSHPSKDKDKNLFSESSYEDVIGAVHTQPGNIVLAFENDDGNITKMYSYSAGDSFKDVVNIIHSVASDFSCLHIAIRETMFAGF